jgi:predicted amidohydrolase YtcJ
MSEDAPRESESLDEAGDLLVLADRVHTLAPDAQPLEHGAVLLRSGRVAAVGSPDALRARAPGCRVLDLAGAVITPGLTDAHVHLTEWAFARTEADLSAAESPRAAAALIAARARGSTDSGDPGWLRGRGWNANRWGGPMPHRTMLDDAVGDRPVALQSHDMHALWASSAALAIAGIDAHTPDPDGGEIVRDDAGSPTGLLLESACQLVARVLPLPDPETTLTAVRAAQAELHTLGITGIHSFPGVHYPDPDPLGVLLELHARQQLQLRVLQHIRLDRLDAAIGMGLRSGSGDEWLRLGAVKMFLDGALGSRTAWMLRPYEDGSGCGISTLAPEEFRAHVRRAAAAGIASTVHAIGDAAVCLALDVLADPALRVPAMPHRIEHLQCCPVERLADAAAAGIACSMQPSHMITDWRAADRYWGTARCRGAFALASLLRHGTTLAFGSDVPVEPVDPRRGLFAAVARQDYDGEPSSGWLAVECISPVEALRGYTVGPAAVAGLEAPAGTLAPGALADLAVWDRDPLDGADAARAMTCLATIVGGRVAYMS